MLNYETLLSSYDDKLTLMQWLKKVEEALKDASAVSFNVNKRGDATLTFSVVFEDGSELETGPITLEQGESVQAATIRNGHLILTLTNGDELDAGDLGGVSGFSINASQHLIVTLQNGTTQDLGAIFSGNVVINGNFEVTGLATLPYIEGDENGNINVDGDIIVSDGSLEIGDGHVSTPILTSANNYIEAEKPVVEVMAGYSFQGGVDSHVNLAYLGISKNGNKLTMVFAGQILGGEDGIAANTRLQIAIVNIPYSIGAKIVPIQSGTNYVDMKHLYIGTEYFLEAEARFYLVKSSNIVFYSAFNLKNALEANAVRAFRYEVTFLLSDNLAA